MSQDRAELLGRLEEAAKDLTFQSEADFPVEPFLLADVGGGPITSALVLKAMKHASGTPVKMETVEQFFEPATQEQDWQNEAERETVRRFQELVRVLEENLADIKVFKVGRTELDVYVVGRTRSGELAGVKTKVVET